MRRRMRYDAAAGRATKRDKQLMEVAILTLGVLVNAFVLVFPMTQMNGSHEKKLDDVTIVRQKVVMLQKENLALVEQVEAFKKQVESVKSKCRS